MSCQSEPPMPIIIPEIVKVIIISPENQVGIYKKIILESSKISFTCRNSCFPHRNQDYTNSTLSTATSDLDGTEKKFRIQNNSFLLNNDSF